MNKVFIKTRDTDNTVITVVEIVDNSVRIDTSSFTAEGDPCSALVLLPTTAYLKLLQDDPNFNVDLLVDYMNEKNIPIPE